MRLYRRALDGEEPQGLAQQAGKLGAYTGRDLTSGYLDGNRGDLTGTSGRRSPLSLWERAGVRAVLVSKRPLTLALSQREKGPARQPACRRECEGTFSADEEAEEQLTEDEGPTYDFSMNVGPKSIDCRV